MDKLDYKKQYKELYQPKTEPTQIFVPAMNFIMIDGKGDPNVEGGEYQQAVELLYALSYTIKMSPKKNRAPEGYFDYVVPPLEGLWWMNDETNFDFTQKDKFLWTSLIRQPEFVSEDVFQWACTEVKKKKPHFDVTKASFRPFEEGLCVQAMHMGAFENESATIAKIESYILEQNLVNDISAILPGEMIRRHHEIYLSDPNKTKPDKMKTVLRHPVKIKEK